MQLGRSDTTFALKNINSPEEHAGSIRLDEVSRPDHGMTVFFHSKWAEIQRFFEVYLYLLFLVGSSIVITYVFKRFIVKVLCENYVCTYLWPLL